MPWAADDPRRIALAERNRNRVWTPAMRVKISVTSKGHQRRKGRTASIEARQKMSKSQRARWTPEMRLAVSQRMKGHKYKVGMKASPETRQKMRDAYRSPWPEERKQRHSEIMKARGISPSREAIINSGKARKGRPLSEKNRLGISRALLASPKVKERARRHVERAQAGVCRCAAHHFVVSPTSLELKLRGLLAEFPDVIEQKSFGRLRVDAYLPAPYHLAFEADGTYWHKDKDDGARDRELMERFQLPVVHLSEGDLKWPAHIP